MKTRQDQDVNVYSWNFLFDKCVCVFIYIRLTNKNVCIFYNNIYNTLLYQVLLNNLNNVNVSRTDQVKNIPKGDTVNNSLWVERKCDFL
jgi:hypothetical protein